MRTTPRWPTYLRIVVTTRCPLRCHYCHAEGHEPTRVTCSPELLRVILAAAVAVGVRKFKFLGGEPLLAPGLDETIRQLVALSPRLDVSLITAGAVPLARLDAAIEAGLTRANVTVHGYTWEAFRTRSLKPGAPAGSAAAHTRRQFAMRQATIERLLAWGRPLKINYVYRGHHDDDDLAALLDALAGTRAVVGVLDDLSNPHMSADTVFATLRRLRGPWQRAVTDDDPHSLPTTHLAWRDGLCVEVKTARLGALAPWKACHRCPVRARCREGIFALRLGTRGQLRPCMDRSDLACDLATPARRGGVEEVAARWRQWVGSMLRTATGRTSAPGPVSTRDAGTVRAPLSNGGVSQGGRA